MPTQRMIAELEGGNIEAEHCIIRHVAGEVELVPLEGARCCINNVSVEGPTKLNQGTESFRFNVCINFHTEVIRFALPCILL